MSKPVMYGIKNCDTIKKARKWLDENGIEFDFHDYRKDGISQEMLTGFEAALGWESLLNKRGTTYRQLSDEQKADMNKDKALALLEEFPPMIKRPVLVVADNHHLGFKADQYQSIFA